VCVAANSWNARLTQNTCWK